MDKPRLRLGLHVFKVCRLCARGTTVVVLLLVCAFVFLRLHGVPAPLLGEIVRRANVAGIPVDVGKMTLTLKGWRADNVRYYSALPDDLEPLFLADRVWFSRVSGSSRDTSSDWIFEVEAEGISINPSIAWGVEIPGQSPARRVDRLALRLEFHPDRIVLSGGEMAWLGVRFMVNGTILTGKKQPAKTQVAASPPAGGQKTLFPVYVDAKRFQALEDRLANITVDGAMEADIDFEIDTADYAASHVGFSFRATDLSCCDVVFSGAELAGRYAYPQVGIQRLELSKDNRSFSLSGNYDLAAGMVEGRVENSIVSNELLGLLPRSIADLLDIAQVEFSELPRFSLSFGRAKPKALLNSIEGAFSIRGVNYRELEIESMAGKVARRHDRLDLTELSATVLGQEERAGQVDSCMEGGSATGAVFWDARSHEFGVSASGSFDPNLIVRPLEMVEIATNIITRFRFAGHPPEISLELGSNYTDWDTFYIDIQGMGNRVVFENVEFSSVNTSAFYERGVLRLDPIAAMQGVDFLKGTASIDFERDTATFDAFGSVAPAALEDVIYSELNLFGNKIATEGDTQIKARGTLDWKTMAATDFRADVEAAHLIIPVARLDAFKGTVIGKGPSVSVEDAAFGFYGGTGAGSFSIQLNPAISNMPYTVELELENADFRKCLQFLRPDVEYKVSGLLSAAARVEADMLRDFFETANGRGSVAVDKGQLADLPFFSGFSYLMRKVIPGFNVFSITSLNGTFSLIDGAIHSSDATFQGDIINATAKGSYAKKSGFDALVHGQVLNDKGISKLFRAITDPIFKIFELKLEGTLTKPTWRLERFSSGSNDVAPANEAVETD